MSVTSNEPAAEEPLQFIRGLPFPTKPFFKKENIEAAFDYLAQDGDIVMCSYPKTGTTWSQYIIVQILSKGQTYPSFDELSHRMVPFLEMSGIEPLKALEKPRFYKHHLPFNQVPKNPKAKYLYVYRRPEDILVSFYHFMNDIMGSVANFDDYFENFMVGKVPYGDYFDHLLSFNEHPDDNLFMFSYEDLHKDKRGQILKIAKFLGDEYYRNVSSDESLMQKIMAVTDFDYMKKNLQLELGNEAGGKSSINFFRKGQVGDGKKTLSNSQKQRLHERMMKKLKGTDFVKLWES